MSDAEKDTVHKGAFFRQTAVCKIYLAFSNGSRPYPSDNAKRQFDVMTRWVGLKMTPVTLY